MHICLFKGVSNAKAIKAALIAASAMDGPDGDIEREKYDFCFMEGKTVSIPVYCLADGTAAGRWTRKRAG